MRRTLFSILTLMLVSGPAWASQGPGRAAGGPTVTVAVVRDGPAAGEDLARAVERELRSLAGEAFEVRFVEAPELNGGWNADGTARALRKALDDSTVDMVLVTGALGAQAAAAAAPSKPVVSGFPQRPDLFAILPRKGDRSAEERVCFVTIPHRVLGDLVAFRDMVHPRTIHVAVPEAYAEELPGLRGELHELATALGLPLEILPLGTDPVASLDAAGPSVEAVYLADMGQTLPGDRRLLIQTLNDRGTPTFSGTGHDDVKDGALAGRLFPHSTPVVRRIALDLYEIARGTPPGDLGVDLQVDSALLINAATAKRIGYVPSRELLVTARYLHPEALKLPEKPLSLGEAFRMARENNVGLKISNQNIETAVREKDLSKTTLLPHLSAIVGGENRKIPGLEDIIPDTIAEAGVTLDQMIFDDQRVSQYNSAKRIVEGTKQAYEVSRMDVLSRTGLAYYTFGLMRVLARVERENLSLTRENLSLARIRMEAGYSGKDEVYRWESEAAKRESELLLRQADVESARIALNRILGIDQSERWTPDERRFDVKVFPLAGGALDPYVKDLISLRKFADAMAAYAEQNAPEMRVLDERIAALEIQLGERKRRWYVPVFSLSAAWAYRFHQSPDIPGIDDDRYKVGIYGSYPLFAGGSRSQEIGRVKSELARLEHERERQRQDVERRTRTAVQRVAASFPGIHLTRRAAESARKNFTVVQDKYNQGLVNITDLLEAQNEVFVTEQSASAAVYRFLRDLIDLQRAISWFEDDATPEEQATFARTIQELMTGDSAGDSAGEGEKK